MQKAERASSLPVTLSPKLLSKVQKGLRIKNQTLQPPTSMQELTISLPKASSARNHSHHPCHIVSVWWIMEKTQILHA